MKDRLTEQQTNKIIEALDDAIANGPWEASNFLRAIGNNLREIRETFVNDADSAGQEKAKMAAHLANRVALRAGQQEIFIALYSSEGNNLQSWERILVNLPKQIISRPIYANEDDLKELIRSKERKVNEAYVSIYISQNDILQPTSDRIPVDKLGKPLLSLKNKSLNLDNINRFVHQSGTYSFLYGRLVKNLPTDPE